MDMLSQGGIKDLVSLPTIGVLAILMLVLLGLLIRWHRQRFERAYLHAVVGHLRWINAMLLGGGRNETGTHLSIQAAFCPLTLVDEDPEASADARAISQDERSSRRGGLLGLRDTAEEQTAARRPRSQRLAYVLLWLAAQAALASLALVFLSDFILTLSVDWRGLNIFTTLRAIGGIAIWFSAALILHGLVLPSARAYWDRQRQCSAEPGTPGREIFTHRRLMIKGSPGCGKTTLLRYIALSCAEDRLAPRLSRRQRRVRQDYGWPDTPFPIYIPLRSLRTIADSGTDDLLSGFADTLRQGHLLGTAMKYCRFDFLRRRLERGGCLLLIDGLDEVGDKLARDRVAKLIAALPQGRDEAPNRLVVTSRKVGYEGQLKHLGFMHQLIRDLDDDQVQQFVEQRFRAFKTMREQQQQPAAWDADERAAELLQRLEQNPSLRLLTINPLLLSIVVGLDFRTNGRPLPRERHVLYRDMVELVVHDWEQYRAQEAGLSRAQQEASQLDDQDKLRMLAELAWAMFEKTLTEAEAQSYLAIRRSEAEAVLARVLEGISVVAATARRERVKLPDFCRQQAARWLDDLNEWGGILKVERREVGSDEELLEFAHRTFQEYLAARAIDEATREVREQRLSRLYARWDDDRWQEVLLLYAAARSNASPVIETLIQRDTLPAWLLAGRVLIERPNNLDPRLREQVLAHLQPLALEDGTVSEETALEALGIMEEAGELPDDQALMQAVRHVPHRTVRVRAIELLAGTEPNTPASAPLAPPLQQLMVDVLDTEQDHRLRLAAGFALARGDPRYEGDGWIPELVEVPSGPFLMGSTDEDTDAQPDEKPQHTRELPTFWIGKTPVTNAQWRRFMEAGGYTTRRYWTRAGWIWRRCGWEAEDEYSEAQKVTIILLGPLFDPLVSLMLRREPFGQPWTWNNPDFNGDNQPIVGISLYEAEAYCRWLSEVTGHSFRLPTEVEWEKAARSPDGRIYPWGNNWQSGCCNSSAQALGKTAPVGSFPAGTSPYGALDLAGNVWEWCRTLWQPNYLGAGKDFEDWLIRILSRWGPVHVTRGGSWGSDRKPVRGASRMDTAPRSRPEELGLRVASDSPYPDAEP